MNQYKDETDREVAAAGEKALWFWLALIIGGVASLAGLVYGAWYLFTH